MFCLSQFKSKTKVGIVREREKRHSTTTIVRQEQSLYKTHWQPRYKGEGEGLQMDIAGGFKKSVERRRWSKARRQGPYTLCFGPRSVPFVNQLWIVLLGHPADVFRGCARGGGVSCAGVLSFSLAWSSLCAYLPAPSIGRWLSIWRRERSFHTIKWFSHGKWTVFIIGTVRKWCGDQITWNFYTSQWKTCKFEIKHWICLINC